jgi:nitrogen regulatory protein PII
MKLIIAILPPEKLGSVQSALSPFHLHMMTVTEVLDCRRGQVTTEVYRGRAMQRPAPRIRLEVGVDDANFDGAVDAIRRSCVTDRAATSDLFVMGLDEGTAARCLVGSLPPVAL